MEEHVREVHRARAVYLLPVYLNGSVVVPLPCVSLGSTLPNASLPCVWITAPVLSVMARTLPRPSVA